MELEWRRPTDDGGSRVTGYVIEMCEAGGLWRRVGYTPASDMSYIVSGLREGHTYFFRVSAENTKGTGQPLQSDMVAPQAREGMYHYFTRFI